MKYPIAEIFHSVQGEGVWTGTPMMFVRLAGCNVGEYADDQLGGFKVGTNPIIQNEDFHLFRERKNSICTTFDGQQFLCDTDYHPTMGMMLVEEIVQQLTVIGGEEHVCITGGEPFLHDLVPLVLGIRPHATIHIETSGTKPIPDNIDAWITLCPKQGAEFYTLVEQERVDEIKLLVGPEFKEELLDQIDAICIEHPVYDHQLFLQPINGVEAVWERNKNKCLALLERYPNWRLSAQLHKYIQVR